MAKHIDVVAQRLSSLRKHLGDRLDEKLTVQDMAERIGMAGHAMGRMEQGKGTPESLIVLLLYYRTQGYNLDWILLPDNTHIPMMLSSGQDQLILNELILRMSQQLNGAYAAINAQLNTLGYFPLTNDPFVASPDTNTPEAFDFSS